MKSWAEKNMSEKEINILQNISLVYKKLPDEDLGNDKNGEKIPLAQCHILARAFSDVFSLKYEDGFFFPNFEHSWLISPEGNVIDVYPVGIFSGPIIVFNKFKGPAQKLYIPSDERYFIERTGKSEFDEAVRKAITIINTIKSQL